MIPMTADVEWSAPAVIFSRTGTLRSAALKPATRWVQAQSEMLDCLVEGAEGWVERRRQATEATLQTFEHVSSAPDFGAVALAYIDWMGAAAQRAQDETVAFGETANAMLRLMFGATKDAAELTEDAAVETAGTLGEAAKRTAARAGRTLRTAAGNAAPGEAGPAS